MVSEGEYWYLIALPEKALCDQLYTMPPVKNAAELYAMLTKDLRIEEAALKALNQETIKMLSEHYHATNIKKLAVLMRRL